jgi:hypothetical protein
LPLYGSETFHGFVFSAPPNQGGKAGLSVPIVRTPSSTRLSEPGAQPGIAAFAAGAAPAPVAVAATARAAAAARRRLVTSSFRMVDRLLEKGVGSRARLAQARPDTSFRIVAR